jgi:CMP-N-acetylneuraminic acid synthetase
VDKTVFVTESKILAKEAEKLGAKSIIRPAELANSGVGIEPTVNYVLGELKKKNKFVPDIVLILYITSPLINSEHIKAAIDTLMIYNADSVISVKEDRKFHHRHGKHGLEPLYEKRLLRQEKDLLYEETGSLIATRRKSITEKSILGKRISHLLLSEDESVDIDNKFQFWLVGQILKNKKIINQLN